MSPTFSLTEMRQLKNSLMGKIRISEQTRKDYMRKFSSIAMQGIDDFKGYVERRDLKPGSYYTYKAAYQFGLVQQLSKLLKDYDTSSKAKDRQSAKECRDAAKECCRILIDLNPDYGLKHYKNPKQHPTKFPGKASKKKTNSKRKSIAGLPADWQDIIYQNVAAKYKNAVLGLMLTGCRPEELRKGINIFMSEQGLIGVKIDGAKVSSTKGHRYRILYFDPDANPLNKAFKQILTMQGSIKIRLPERNPENPDSARTVNAFTRAVKYTAGKAGRKFAKVSPYTFRHQKSADLKKEGHSKEMVAAFLGHRSTRTQQQYGSVQQGRGGTGISRVEVPDIVPGTYEESTPQGFESGVCGLKKGW
tara:strand:- start:415 stop:1497 length:1083 start_codon:yes stop_codon:yes gene_type:complete